MPPADTTLVTLPVVPLTVKSLLSRLETASLKVRRHTRPPVALVVPLTFVVCRVTEVTVGATLSATVMVSAWLT